MAITAGPFDHDEYHGEITQDFPTYLAQHKGSLWSASYTFEAAAALTTSKFLVRVNGKQLVVYWGIEAGGPFRFDLLEAPTVTDYGTEITPRNYRRDLDDTAIDAQFYHGSATSAGTNIVDTMLGSTYSSSGSFSTALWRFKSNTDYLFQLYNVNVQTAFDCSVKVEVFEEV